MAWYVVRHRESLTFTLFSFISVMVCCWHSLGEICCEVVNCIQLLQHRVKWQTFVTTVMDLGDQQSNVLSSTLLKNVLEGMPEE